MENLNYLYVLVALFLGVYQGFIYKKTGPFSQNFLITISVLPALVSLVLMCVNGNIGSSIAILGVFSLVRFRSIAGNSREILNIFYSMTIGLLCISGDLIFASIISIFIGILIFVFYKLNFFKPLQTKTLKITIPESLTYDEIFNTILNEYTSYFKLVKVRTVKMGSLFELSYEIILKDERDSKALIDNIRCKNANLNISLYQSEDYDIQL